MRPRRKPKPDRAEKIAFHFDDSGENIFGSQLAARIRRAIRDAVKAERERIAAELDIIAGGYAKSTPTQVTISTHVGAHLRRLATSVRNGPQ